MDVLHVTQPTTEGVGRIVHGLVRYQIASGLKVAVASPGTSEFYKPLIEMGCHWSRWDAVRHPMKGLRSEWTRLGSIVRETNPRAIHLHSSKAGLVGRFCVRNRVTTVFHPNGWSFHVGSPWMKRAALAFEIFAAKRWTDSVICVSQGERDAMAKRIHGSKLHVIHNGIDLSKWTQSTPSQKARAREKLGVDLQTPLVVAVGRVSLQKGPDHMLAIWPKVKQQCQQAHLIWVGEGDMRGPLIEKFAYDPSVQFPGASDQAQTFFEAADVVIMPSRWEGHSISLLEALATGRPVVAFDVDGMSDTITDDIGAVVPAGDTASFSKQIIRILQQDASKRDALECRAHMRIQQHFDCRIGYQQITILYRLSRSTIAPIG